VYAVLTLRGEVAVMKCDTCGSMFECCICGTDDNVFMIDCSARIFICESCSKIIAKAGEQYRITKADHSDFETRKS